MTTELTLPTDLAADLPADASQVHTVSHWKRIGRVLLALLLTTLGLFLGAVLGFIGAGYLGWIPVVC